MTKEPLFQQDLSLEEIRRVRDLRAPLRHLYNTGIQRGESTGWPSLDGYFTARAREWTLVTGIPGHGKTQFLDNLMLNLAQFSGWNWAVFSAENLPLERHVATLMSQYIGRPFAPGWRTRIDEEEFAIATAFLDDRFTFLQPREDSCNIDRILALAEMLCTHGDGIQGMVIDPWNELDHSRPGSLNETEYVSRSLTKIRRFAREHEIHVFLVAHPTKLQRVKVHTTAGEAQIYPIPTPYDVSGSAHFRNKADNCLCVWRDVANDQSPTQIHIQKIRFSEVGHVGMVELHFDKPTGQFIDATQQGPRLYKKKTGADLLEMAKLLHSSTERLRAHGVYGPARQPGDDDE